MPYINLINYKIIIDKNQQKVIVNEIYGISPPQYNNNLTANWVFCKTK